MKTPTVSARFETPMVVIQPRQVCGSNFKRFGSALWARALRKWSVSEHGGIPNGKLWYTNVLFLNSCYTLWTWGDTIRIPWGDTMGVPYLPKKKTARDPPSWSCFDALFGWPNGECFTTSRNKNTLEPQIWYRRWYPRGFASNVGENMDDINRDIYEILSGIFWDTGW